MRRVLLALAATALLAAGCAQAATPVVLPAVPTPSPLASLPLAAGHAPRHTFAVDTRIVKLRRDDRSLPTTVYYPRTATGRFPVVVFSHGLGGTPAAYAELLRRWAAAGFVVAAPAFPHTRSGATTFDVMDVVNQPADVAAVLDGLTALPASDGLRRVLDPTRAAAAGHSAGGITTVGVFSDDGPEGRDRRFTAGIVLAGNSFGVGQTFTGPAAPMLFVHAGGDPVVPVWTDRAVYDALPWPRAFLQLTGDEHTAPYVSRRNAQFAEVVAATVDFLRWALYRDVAARDRLAKLHGIDAHL